jgi:hypothetical protein
MPAEPKTYSIEARRALRYFTEHRGPLRRNSGAFRRVAEEIRTSPNPMATAKDRLKAMHRVREHEQRHGLTTIAHDLTRQHQGVNTVVLDLVIAELRRGFPGGRLDPIQIAMIEAFEAEIFARAAAPDHVRNALLNDLLALIDRLTKVGVYDSRRACWHTYRQP